MRESILNTKDVCYLIVTYNPSLFELESILKRLLIGDSMIYIIDNSTSLSTQDSILNLESDKIKVKIMKSNIGIAAGQNVGMKQIFKQDYKGVLLLDQDSHFTHEMLKKICDTYNLISKIEKVGCIGPLAYDVDKGESELYNFSSLRSVDTEIIEVEKTLSSGSLITREAYDQVGEMDAKLFIDLVDWEWCWRSRSKGFKIYINKNILMPHKLGEGRKRVFLNIKVGQPAPIRHYYQFRNYLILIRRKYIPISFKSRYFLLYLLKFFYYAVFLKPRLKRIKYMVNGIKDGIFLNYNRNIE